MPTVQEIRADLDECRRQSNPLNAFNEIVLQSVDTSNPLWDGSYRGQFWKAQRDVCRAVWDDSVTTVAVPAGHSVGKSFCGARIIIGCLTLWPDSLVVSTGPSNTQIEEVLWKEVRSAFRNSKISEFGRLTANPQKLDYGDGYHALGYSTNKAERLQGHHAKGPVVVVIDEACGVENPETWEVLISLKPHKRILFSNTIRPDGPFYDVCQRGKDDPSVRVIHIPSLASPDISQEHSERGLADAAWLREMAAEYGVGSLVWRVRVLAQFPDDATDSVFKREWLDLAFRTVHQPRGENRLAIDLGLGNGGDLTVHIVRDDNGVLHCEASNTVTLEAAASRAAVLAQRFKVEPHRVSYDVEGIGADFANRLEAVGLKGCQPYRGGGGGTKKYANMRAQAAWKAHQRLDPQYMPKTPEGLLVPQMPFSLVNMPAKSQQMLRKELQELRYQLGPSGDIVLEKAEDYAERLKRSPDHVSAFTQAFAFGN